MVCALKTPNPLFFMEPLLASFCHSVWLTASRFNVVPPNTVVSPSLLGQIFLSGKVGIFLSDPEDLLPVGQNSVAGQYPKDLKCTMRTISTSDVRSVVEFPKRLLREGGVHGTSST